MDSNIRVGDKIRVLGRFRRISTGLEKRWKFVESKEPMDVLFLGKRTLSDGKVFYYDGGIEYNPKHYFTAILVIRTDGRTNPFYTREVVNDG